MPTDVVNQLTIRELIEPSRWPCVSLFLITHCRGQQQQRDVVRYENLLARARDELLRAGCDRPQVESILKSADRIRGEAVLWQHASEGLAVFCAPHVLRVYLVPIPLEEGVAVGDGFQVKPLLPLLCCGGRFFILALGQDRARLYESTGQRIRELLLPPIERAMRKTHDAAIPLFAGRQPRSGRSETEPALEPCEDGPGDWEKQNILLFFQRLNRAVTRRLRGQRSPLLLASVGYLASLYESANSYRHLVKAKIPGNPDRWSPDELREHACRLVEPYFSRCQCDALEKLCGAAAGGLSSSDLSRVVLSADQGRVETLFLQSGARKWGKVDRPRQTVQLSEEPGADHEELLDFAAIRTLTNGGEVHVLDRIPATDSPIAAIFRC